MKIVVVQGAFMPVPPKMGGAVEKMWFLLAKDFAKKGHEVYHISRTFKDFPEEEWIDGVFFKRIRGYDTPASGVYLKLLDLLYSIRVRKVIPKEFDIIITNTFFMPVVMQGKYKQKCVVDVQRMPKGQMPLYKKSVSLRGNSTAVVKKIKEEIPESLHHKVVMIPNLLPFNNLNTVDYAAKRNVLLYTGRIHPEKGLELLIKAFSSLPASDWKLNIVGPWRIDQGGGGPDYKEQLKKLAGNAAIEFKEPTYDIELLNQYYKEASIFCYPSVAEQGESFGLAPMEGMAWGCVPVVSNLDCFKDFIVHDKNGLIFDHRSPGAVKALADNIERLQKDQSLRFQLSQEGLKVRESHSPSSVGDLFLGHFQQLIAK